LFKYTIDRRVFSQTKIAHDLHYELIFPENCGRIFVASFKILMKMIKIRIIVWACLLLPHVVTANGPTEYDEYKDFCTYRKIPCLPLSKFEEMRKNYEKSRQTLLQTYNNLEKQEDLDRLIIAAEKETNFKKRLIISSVLGDCSLLTRTLIYPDVYLTTGRASSFIIKLTKSSDSSIQALAWHIDYFLSEPPTFAFLKLTQK